MTIQRKLDRSWLIVWAFCALVIAVSIGLVQVDKAVAEVPGVPAFRIVDVRAEQGQLVVEAQHFYPNGNDWFYNLYTWQGLEEYKHPRVTNEDGELLLEDDSVALYKTNPDGQPYQYVGYSKVHFEKTEAEGPNPPTHKVVYIDNAYGNLNTDLFEVGATPDEVFQYQGKPDIETELIWEYRNGPDWKRHDYPFLDEPSILKTISDTHKVRLESGWTKDRGRAVLPYSNHSKKDQSGSEALVKRFEGLAYTWVEAELGPPPEFEQQYTRNYTPRTFTVEGQEYLGEVSNLATILQEFERIELRTRDSKTYQVGNNSRRTVFQKSMHFKNPRGEWDTTDLRFKKVEDQDIWLMGTHPLYSVYGALNHISMISPEGEAGARWYTPSILTYEGNSAWYEHDGLRWTYTLSGTGIKLTSEVVSPRNAKEYEFTFLPLGTTNPLRIDASGNATTSPEYDLGDLGPDAAYFYYEEYADENTGPHVVVPKAVIIGADGGYYPGGDWEIVDAYRIKFSFNDDTLPAQAFPYTIDPTTSFEPDAHTEVDSVDGFVGHGVNADWTSVRLSGGNQMNDDSTGIYGAYLKSYTSSNVFSTIYRGILLFDTEPLPDDALITSATFRAIAIDVAEQAWSDGIVLTGLHPNNPASNTSLVSADYYNAFNLGSTTPVLGMGTPQGTAYSSPLPIQSIHPCASICANIDIPFELPLNAAGIAAINKAGITRFGTRGRRDFENDPPTWVSDSKSEVKYASADHATLDPPTLTVNYTWTSLYACQSTTATFYPDSGVGNDSVDGEMQWGTSSSTWDVMHDSLVTSAGTTGQTWTTGSLFINSGSSWNGIGRVGMLFDTTPLPDDATIIRGSLSTTGNSSYYQWSVPQEAVVVSFNPAKDNELVGTDYSFLNWGSVFLSDTKIMNELITDKITQTHWILTSEGLAHIDPTDISRFGLRVVNDVEDNDYWEYDRSDRYTLFMADETDPGDRRPKLTVEYIIPCAGLSGTVSNSITSIFYPGTTSDGTTTDGNVDNNQGSGSTKQWGEIHAGPGVHADDNLQYDILQVTASSPSYPGKWADINRNIYTFDTGSVLPNYGCTTGSATYSTGDAGSTDGYVRYYKSGNMTFAQAVSGVDGGGTLAADHTGGSGNYVHLSGTTGANLYDTMRSIILIFDTSDLPSDAVVTSGILSYQTNDMADFWGGLGGGAVTTQPTASTVTAMETASDTAVATGDYHFREDGVVNKLADDILWSDLVIESGTSGSTFNNHKLNSRGVEHIDPDGFSKFAIRTNHDASGVEPPWVSGYYAYLAVELDEENSGTSNDPKLYLEWTVPCPGIHSAKFEFVTEVIPGGNKAIFPEYVGLVTAEPAVSYNLASGDWATMGSVLIGNKLDYTDINHDDITYNTMGFNDVGLGWIKSPGITEVGLKLGADIDDKPYYTAAEWASFPQYAGVYFGISSADNTSAYRPKLTVVHGDSSAANIDGGDITAGTQDIVLTLNGAHWTAAGSAFNAIRQDIINGLDGSLSGAGSWDTEVRPNIAVGDVVRTSDSVVTIDITATGKAGYDPATTETITATINAGVTNPTVTFQPDAHPESDTFDGYTEASAAGESWAQKQAITNANWTTASQDRFFTLLYAGTGSGDWKNIDRTMLLFDTGTPAADIPTDAVIVSAKIGLVPLENYADWYSDSVVVTSASPASNTNILSTDYPSFGSTNFGEKRIREFNIINGTDGHYQYIDLNSFGLAHIENDGITKFGLQSLHFFNDDEPTWCNPCASQIGFASMEHATAKGPILVVTYERAADSNVEIIANPVFLIDPIPFDFTSFTPTMAANSGTLQITVTGTGMPEHVFAGSEALTLIKSGQPNIDCSSVSGTGGTSVVVDCVVNGAATGLWDVYVENASGLNDTKLASLTLYQNWSSSVTGGSFSPGGSDYGIFAHTATPYFTVQGFDEVEKEWLTSSSPPPTIPLTSGKDATFNSDKSRIVVSTASAANALWAYEFNSSTGVIGTEINPVGGAVSMDVNAVKFINGENVLGVATGGGDFFYVYDVNTAAAIGSFFTTTSGLANGATKPTAACNAIDFSPSGSHIALGCDSTGSDYFHVYTFDNATPAIGVRLANPSVGIPSDEVTGVAFSPDGTKLAVTYSNYLTVYDFPTMSNWNHKIISAGNATGVAWLPEDITGDTLIAISSDASPYVEVYEFDTDGTGSFGAAVGDPSTALTSAANFVGFHPNGDSILVGQVSSPYVTAYNFTGVSDDDYRVYRYLANFDTSYLPDDAVITAATLSIYVDSLTGSGWQILVQDAEDGSEPLVLADYDQSNWTTLVTAGAHTPTVGLNVITLNNYSGIKSGATGVSQFILRHEQDVGNTEPTVKEVIDIEVGNSTTFDEDCLVSNPTVLRSNSLYNLCNSPNVPTLQLTYTSVAEGTPGDLEVILTDSHTANSDGTHTTSVFAKGPVIYLETSTSPSTETYDVGLNRVIADTANEWNFLNSTIGKPFPFMRSLETYSDDGITKNLWYQLESEPKAQMEDQSGYGFDSDYMSFPNDSSSLTSTVEVVIGIEGTSVSIGDGAGVPSMADDSSGSDIVMSGTSNTSNEGLPLAGFFDYVEEAGGMPTGIIKLMFAMVVTILAGLIAFKSFQSVAASYIAMLMAIVAFTLGMNGIFEWWMLLTFGLTGAIFIFTRRAYV